MQDNDFTNKLKRLKKILREALLLLPLFQKGEREAELGDYFNRCCKLLFSDDFYESIWDEGVLFQLQKLFQFKTPHQKRYGEKLARIARRTAIVQQINDIFFSIISSEFSEDEVCKRISALVKTSESFPLRLKASNRLRDIRSSTVSVSDKIGSFIDHLMQDLEVDFDEMEDALHRVLESLKAQEALGGVNALLINIASQSGVVVPLQFCF